MVDDGSRIYVVQGLGTSRHINTLGGAQFLNRLCEGFSLIMEGLLLVDLTRVNTTVARPQISPFPRVRAVSAGDKRRTYCRSSISNARRMNVVGVVSWRNVTPRFLASDSS